MYTSRSAASWRLGGPRKSPISPPLRPRAKQIPSNGEDKREPSGTNIPLPQGVWWLKHANVKKEAAYGDSFVIHRPEQSQTELMLAPQEDMMVQVWHPNVGAHVLLRPPFHLLPPEFDSDVRVVEVEYVPLEKETSALVFAGEGPVCENISQPSSPRRTRKVKFTCNRCQTRTEKFINPHAWNHGVVFCRCDGCNVVHLIRDQKGIFSCLKGPLFPQVMDPKSIKIPKGLPQNPVMPNREDDDTAFWLI